VIVELMRNNDVKQKIEVTNSHRHSWSIPKRIKTGKGYSLRVSSAQQHVMSSVFTIKRAIPLLAKGVPVVLLAMITLWPDDKEETLPGPINP
jgi:hypothetical protein